MKWDIGIGIGIYMYIYICSPDTTTLGVAICYLLGRYYFSRLIDRWLVGGWVGGGDGMVWYCMA